MMMMINRSNLKGNNFISLILPSSSLTTPSLSSFSRLALASLLHSSNAHPSPSPSNCNLDDAFNLFDEMSHRKPTLPSSSSSFSVIKFNQVLTDVANIKHFPSPLHSDRPLSIYQNVTNLDEALSLFHRLIHRRPLPSVIKFNQLLNAVTKINHFSSCINMFNHIAIALLRLMDERGCKPNVVVYSTIIDSLCKDKMIDDAFKLFKEMVFHKRILPNVITYNCLIYGLCILGHWEEVSKLLKEMEHERISPDLQTFSILVDAFCKDGKINEAEAVIDIMVDRGVVPDIVTYSSLIDGYCLRGEMTKARTLFDSITSKGPVPNVVTYSSLLNGYCKNLKIEEAMHVGYN